MNKIRCFLAAMALVATLSGFSVQGMGLARAASGQHASSPSVMSSVAVWPFGPCPVPGIDC